MALTWPDDLLPYTCEFYLQHNSTVFESPLTRTRQVLRRQGERWVCSAGFRLSRAKAQRLEALLIQAKGVFDTFRIWDFDRYSPLGDNREGKDLPETDFTDNTDFTDGTAFDGGSDTAIVYGDHARGDATILTRGWYGGLTVLKAGDYVGIGGYLYMLTADATADGTGAATLSIAPPLRAAVTHKAAITHEKPTVEVRLVDDDQPKRRRIVGGLYEFSLSFVEAL